MTVHKEDSTRTQELLPFLVVALVFLLLCAVWDRFLLPGDRDLWDARVYARAIGEWRSGSDPYSLASGGLPFVYPPIFLRLSSLLSHVVHGRVAWLPYLALLILCTIATPWMLAVDYLRSRWLTPLIALLLFSFQPKLFAEMVFLSGNLGSILYALILATGIPGLRRNHWLWFYLAIAIAALIKPPFLCFLILPFFAGRRQFWQPILTASVTLAAYASQWLMMPALFRAFQNAVTVQIVVRQDAGFGFLAYFLRIDHRLPRLNGLAAPLAYVAVMAAIFAALIYLHSHRRGDGASAADRLWLPMLLVLAIIANPRMQVYDAEIAMVPAIFLCVECIALIPPSRFRTPVLVTGLAMLAALLSKSADAAVFLFLIGSVLLSIRTIALAQEPSVSPADRHFPDSREADLPA